MEFQMKRLLFALWLLCAGPAAAQVTADSIARLANAEATDTVSALAAVSPPRLPGLKLDEAYGGACKWKCMVYLTNDGGDWGWPAIVVHQPFPVSGEVMLDAWIKAQNADKYDVVRAEGERSVAQESGARIVMTVVRVGANHESAGESSPHVLAAIERGGASLIVELATTFDSDIAEVSGTFSSFVSGVQFDGAAIARASTVQVAVSADAFAAVARAYGSGATAEIYSRARLIFGVTGYVGMIPSMGNVPSWETLVLLPGGVALELAPKTGLRTPDLASVYGTTAPTRWTRQGSDVILKRDGKSDFRLKGSATGRLMPPSEDDGSDPVAWSRVRALGAKDLAGRYRRSWIASMGGGVEGMVMTSSSGAADYVLGADGTYTFGEDRNAGANGNGVAVYSKGGDNETGRWRFDAASATVTFDPKDKPAYERVFFQRHDECYEGECRWQIGDDDYERPQ
jgi:hypothetical protein